MNVSYKRDQLIELFRGEKLNFDISIQDDFILDVEELKGKFDEIKEETFEEKFQELVKQVNTAFLNDQNQSDKKFRDIVYKEYGNKFRIEIAKHELIFEFYFDKKNNKLVFTHFDKLVRSKKVFRKTDMWILFAQLFVLITILFVAIYKKQPIQLKSILAVFTLPVINLILLFTVRHREHRANDKTIWVNQETFDLFRKWFRSSNISDWTRIFYFVSWLNLWLFCLVLLSIPTGSNFWLTVGIVLLVLIIVLYAIQYLLKMFNSHYLSTFILTTLVFFIGFLNKDYWAFVALVSVIVNQVLSKDIIYLANDYKLEERYDIESKIDSFVGKANEIKLKVQSNIIIAFIYLIIVFYNKSILLKPVLEFLSPKLKTDPIEGINILALGVERIVLLVFFISVLISNIRWISALRRKIEDWLQILVNYVSHKLYNDMNWAKPIFKDEFSIFPNEDIEPKELISNFKDLPSDTKVIWVNKPNWSSSQKQCNVEVLVIYPNREHSKHSVVLKKIVK